MNNTKINMARTAGRKATINREDVIQAALRLVGPNRSISTLSLREITREAGIAPNSFYRHFRNTEELVIVIINQAGLSLNQVIDNTDKTQQSSFSAANALLNSFINQLSLDKEYLPILLREGTVGSQEYKNKINEQIQLFEKRLVQELFVSIKAPPLSIELLSKAITQLILSTGSRLLDAVESEYDSIRTEIENMIFLLIKGAEYNPNHNKLEVAEMPT